MDVHCKTTILCLLNCIKNNPDDRLVLPLLTTTVLTGGRDIIDLLIEGGLRLSTKNKSGESLLFDTVKSGQADSVRELVKHGIDVNETKPLGQNVRFVPTQRGCMETGICPAENGANIPVEDNVRYTMLDVLFRDIGSGDELLFPFGMGIQHSGKSEEPVKANVLNRFNPFVTC